MHPHVTPEQTPQHSPQRDAPLIENPLGLSKGISRAEPFDMWAAQNGIAQSEQVKTHSVLLIENICQKASFVSFAPRPGMRSLCLYALVQGNAESC